MGQTQYGTNKSLGAGTSIAAGMPTFNGENMINKKDKELFHVHALKVSGNINLLDCPSLKEIT